ncbi:MAG: hypothetical protein ACK40O_12305 [Allosphingosinicella sp.]
MQFLKTLFWIVLTIILVLFAKANWFAVTLKLWGGMEADVKLPILVLAAFLLGFVPTMLIYRARIWALKRRYEPVERRVSVSTAPPPAAAPAAGAPSAAVPGETVDNGADAPADTRVATDSKVWPNA